MVVGATNCRQAESEVKTKVQDDDCFTIDQRKRVQGRVQTEKMRERNRRRNVLCGLSIEKLGRIGEPVTRSLKRSDKKKRKPLLSVWGIFHSVAGAEEKRKG